MLHPSRMPGQLRGSLLSLLADFPGPSVRAASGAWTWSIRSVQVRVGYPSVPLGPRNGPAKLPCHTIQSEPIWRVKLSTSSHCVGLARKVARLRPMGGNQGVVHPFQVDANRRPGSRLLNLRSQDVRVGLAPKFFRSGKFLSRCGRIALVFRN